MEFIFFLLLIAFTVILYVIPTLIVVGIVAMLVSWMIDRNADPYDLSESDGDYFCPICKDTTDWCTHGP